jgi:hypothetical protein
MARWPSGKLECWPEKVIRLRAVSGSSIRAHRQLASLPAGRFALIAPGFRARHDHST